MDDWSRFITEELKEMKLTVSFSINLFNKMFLQMLQVFYLFFEAFHKNGINLQYIDFSKMSNLKFKTMNTAQFLKFLQEAQVLPHICPTARSIKDNLQEAQFLKFVWACSL